MQNHYITSIKFWIIASFLFCFPYIFLLRDSLDQNIGSDGAPNPGLIVIIPLFGIFYLVLFGYWILLIRNIVKAGVWKKLFFWITALIFIYCFNSISHLIYIIYTTPSIHQNPLVHEILGKKGCFEFYSIESGKDVICLKKVEHPYKNNPLYAREYYIGEKGTYHRYDSIYKKNGSEWHFSPFDKAISSKIYP